jgi:hypothetical protein
MPTSTDLSYSTHNLLCADKSSPHSTRNALYGHVWEQMPQFISNFSNICTTWSSLSNADTCMHTLHQGLF